MRLRLLILFFTGISLTLYGQREAPPLLPEVGEVTPPKNDTPQSGLGGLFSGIKLETFAPPSLPNNLDLLNTGKITYEKKNGIIRYGGLIRAKGDNGLRLKSTGASYSDSNKTLTLHKKVVLDDPKGVRIYADNAVFDTLKNKVNLKGNIRAYQGPTVYYGDSIIYDIEKQNIQSDSPTASIYPFILDSSKITHETRDGNDVIISKNSAVTTDDVKDPSYWLRSEQTTIYPDDRIVFENLSIDVGDRTIFKFPRYTQHFDPRLGFLFTPGARTNLGPFLKTRYGTMLGNGGSDSEADKPWLLAQYLVDFYGTRGVGLGLNLIDTRLDDNPNLKGLSIYYINDLSPDRARSSIDRDFVNEDRYRISFQDRRQLGNYAGLDTYLDTNINILSDDFFLDDFYRELARNESEPDNTIAVVGRGDHSLLTGLIRFRPNDFYRSDTRLPEITFEQTRHPIFNLPVYYENQSSFGILREEESDPFSEILLEQRSTLPPGPELDSIDELLADRSFTRLHTYHELTAQYNYGGWFNFVPRVGAGYTYYSNIAGGIGSQGREIVSAGFDASVTWSRSMPGIINKKWGLDGLVHVFQPYTSFSHVEADELDSNFLGIDRFPASTRPQQLEIGRFTAIDDLNDWSIIRTGIRNQLITRRGDNIHNWLSLDTFIDIFNEDPEFDRSISNLYNDLTWNPVPWAQFNLRSQFPITSDEDGFSDISTSADFMPNNSTRIGIGYRYLDSHPILEDTNIVNFYAYHRINDEWGVSLRHDWRLEDGRLEVQQYSVHRDWGAWTGSMGVSQRRNDGENELGVIFSLTLKDIPSLTLPFALEAQ